MATKVETRFKATTMMPSLTVDDVQGSITFFEGLGFGVQDRWEENGVLMGVMLQAGDVHLGLSQDDWKKGRDRQKGLGVRFYMETAQNIDELASAAKQAGLKLDKDAHDTSWGTRAFEITEPSGYLLTIASPAASAT